MTLLEPIVTNRKVRATLKWRHHFWGDYCATLILECESARGKATFPVTVVVTFHSSGKTTTLTFTRDSCTEIDIEPGSIGAVLEDQSGQSDDGGFTIEQ